jgi:hypothetical protein
MTNPWMKKNPYLSLWLSGANAVAGKARAPMAAAMRRQQAALTRQSMEFWMNAWTSAIKPKPREPRS